MRKFFRAGWGDAGSGGTRIGQGRRALAVLFCGGLAAALLAGGSTCGWLPWGAPATYPEYKTAIYQVLDAALAQRKAQLIAYLSDIQARASAIKKDAFAIRFFQIMNAYETLRDTGQLSAAALEKTRTVREKFKEHYILSYHCFYDVLFINPQGEIFYTIREQPDYHKNIFEGELKATALSQKMQSEPAESFVDFQFYEISGEPSAFFIEPVQDQGRFRGWIVLQFAINKINHLFSRAQDMGDTSEIFLVNHDHYMLTDSRFMAESTILKEQLAAENIASKFSAGQGHKAVTDYRGQEAISSFEVFSFLGSQWLIIAKMDEAEVFTDFYRYHPEKLETALDRLRGSQAASLRPGRFAQAEDVEVDIDEFRRTEEGQSLYTHGVSTCTALVLKYPGRFTYFAHISPYDKVYGEDRTDLVAHMLRKIEYLEITESDKHKLRFYLASPDTAAFVNTVRRLLAHGYFLSQIKILHHADARRAEVVSPDQSAEVLVNWKMKDGDFYRQRASDTDSLMEQLLPAAADQADQAA
ncbi:MAG: cache domain-containing protein [Desulfosudaceae bacterium]